MTNQREVCVCMCGQAAERRRTGRTGWVGSSLGVCRGGGQKIEGAEGGGGRGNTNRAGGCI